MFPVTDLQQTALAAGRAVNPGGRLGRPHRPETRATIKAAGLAYWAANPDKALARARRAEQSPNWKGGVTRLNVSIRQMDEYRKWARLVRARDGCCQQCGSIEKLEAHHREELAVLLARLGVVDRATARVEPKLWDTENGVTLCRPCHYAAHERPYRGN